MAQPRRREYSAQARARFTAMVVDEGRSTAEVAREWGINSLTLGTWASRERARRANLAALAAGESVAETVPAHSLEEESLAVNAGMAMLVEEKSREVQILSEALGEIRAVLLKAESDLGM